MPDSMVASEALSETWMPESAELRSQYPLYASAAEALVAELRPPSRICAGCVDVHRLAGLTAVASVFADPHSDDSFLPWFVLWVLRSNQHTLHVADYDGPEDGMAHLAADVSVPLLPGHVLIMPAHKAHWMTAGPSLKNWRAWPWRSTNDGEQPEVETLVRPHWFVAASFDTQYRPTRSDAEAIILAGCGGPG